MREKEIKLRLNSNEEIGALIMKLKKLILPETETLEVVKF